MIGIRTEIFALVILKFYIYRMKIHQLKIHLFFLIASLFLVGTSVYSQPVHFPSYDLQPKDTIFSKNQIVVCNASKDTIEISDFRNGKKNGVQKLFFNNSALKYKASYKDGLLDGKAETYQQNKMNPIKIERYKSIPSENKSVLHGLSQTFDFEGNLLEKTNYKNGLKNGKYKIFHANRNLKQEGTYEDELDIGRKKLYDTNGVLLKDENFIIIDNPAYQKVTNETSLLPEEIPKPKSGTNVPKKNAVLHGKVKYYFSSGRISADLNYKNGQKEGVNKEYYDDLTNSPRSEVVFKNGKEHGKFVYYRADGNVERKGIYYAEMEVGDTLLKNVYEGEIVFYQENGVKNRVENWENFKRNGAFETYAYRIGTLSTRTNYKDNLKSGKEQHFDKNGQLTYEVSNKIKEMDGQKVSVKSGTQTVWENGKLKSIVEWMDDKRQGFQKSYYPNGKIEQILFLKNDTITGTYQNFYENGQMKDDLFYYRKPKSDVSYYIKWNKRYDENGDLNQIFYGMTSSEYVVNQKFKNRKPQSLTIENFMRINYSEFDGSLQSLEWKEGGIAFGFYTHGMLRSLSFSNSNSNPITASFSSEGEMFQMIDTTGKQTEDAELEGIAQEISKQFNKNWTHNPPISILENNGNAMYKWEYADGKPFFHIEFKDSLPNGKWIVHHPVRNDSLFYGELNKGNPVGKWTKKRMDGSYFYQKKYDSHSNLLENKQYGQNGKLLHEIKNDERGNKINEVIYYENGLVKEMRNQRTKSYINFNEKGDTLSYNILKPGKDSISFRKDFYANNTIRLEEVQSRIDGAGIRKVYFENKVLRYYTELKNWKKDGVFEEYNDSGKLIKKGTYSEGKREGEWVNYLPDGSKQISHFKEDELIIPEKSEDNLKGNNCKCYDTTLNKSKIGFANSMKYLADYQSIKPYIPKTIIPIDEFNYDKIFYLGNNFNSDRNHGYAQFKMLPLAGFSFYYPSADYLKFDLIPCPTEAYVNNFDTSISYSNADKSVTYVSLHPKRISIELIKNPLTNATNQTNFKAYFDTKGIDFDSSGIRTLDLNSDKNACYSDGLVNNFMHVKVWDANPVVQMNKTLNTEDLPILPEEVSKFYGLDIIQSEISFNYLQNTENVLIQSSDNKILAGSNFVVGRISIKGKSEKGKEFKTEEGKIIEIDSLKSFLEQKGWYRLRIEMTENNLILWFYAE